MFMVGISRSNVNFVNVWHILHLRLSLLLLRFPLLLHLGGLLGSTSLKVILMVIHLGLLGSKTLDHSNRRVRLV